MSTSSPSESPHVAAARSLTAASRHEEAVKELVRGANAGDLAAMSVLGHLLLVGRNAPHLPSDGVRLIQTAAAKGEPDALHRIAVLTAGGAFFTQDWAGAFRLLAQAAEAGSAAARKQLAALSSRSAEGESWLRLAEAIDLASWLTPSQGENLTPGPRVVHFPRLVPDVVCAWLIECSRSRLERARVYDSVNGRETTSETRSNSAATFDLATVDVVQFMVQVRMAAACGVPWTHMEPPSVLHYAVGEQITDHFDFVNPDSRNYQQLLREQGERVVTFLLYLNDDYTGGETAFPELGITHKGSRGAGLYFRNAGPDGRPDKQMLHAGHPPASGEKWIVSQFIRSIPRR